MHASEWLPPDCPRCARQNAAIFACPKLAEQTCRFVGKAPTRALVILKYGVGLTVGLAFILGFVAPWLSLGCLALTVGAWAFSQAGEIYDAQTRTQRRYVTILGKSVWQQWRTESASPLPLALPQEPPRLYPFSACVLAAGCAPHALFDFRGDAITFLQAALFDLMAQGLIEVFSTNTHTLTIGMGTVTTTGYVVRPTGIPLLTPLWRLETQLLTALNQHFASGHSATQRPGVSVYTVICTLYPEKMSEPLQWIKNMVVADAAQRPVKPADKNNWAATQLFYQQFVAHIARQDPTFTPLLLAHIERPFARARMMISGRRALAHRPLHHQHG